MFSGYLTCHFYFYNKFPHADWLKAGVNESIDYRNDVMTAVYIHVLHRLLRTTTLSVVKHSTLQIESLLHSTLHYYLRAAVFQETSLEMEVKTINVII